MSKVYFRYSDGFEITKDILIDTILHSFVSNFGFKPPKSYIKFNSTSCYPISIKWSDGFIDEGYICNFFIVPGDGRTLHYKYDSVLKTLDRI